MKLTLKPLAKIRGDQDGAIFGDLLFRFNSHGRCRVYDMKALMSDDGCEQLEPITEFHLDKLELVDPHSNAVFFGKEYFDENDEFPILYTNVYNNYKKCEDRREGMLVAYRIIRSNGSFETQLLGIVQIGFTKDETLWRSADGFKDVRPYGNFVYCSDTDRLYAFVMRDLDKKTRYFAFKMPLFKDAQIDKELGVKKIVLQKEDIIEYFDTPYHVFVQGAIMKNGLVYSTEGFGEREHPAIRVIDTKAKKQIFFCDLYELDCKLEAEFIDFYEERCIYGNAYGDLFELVFE